MPEIGIKFLTTLIVTISVVTVAATCLGVTIGINFRLFKHIGQEWARHIADGVSVSVEAYILRKEAILVSGSNFARQNEATNLLPSQMKPLTGENWTEYWKTHMLFESMKQNWSFSSYSIFFEDGWWMYTSASRLWKETGFYAEWIELGDKPYSNSTDLDRPAYSGGSRFYWSNYTVWPYGEMTNYTTETLFVNSQTHPVFRSSFNAPRALFQRKTQLATNKLETQCTWFPPTFGNFNETQIAYWETVGICDLKNISGINLGFVVLTLRISQDLGSILLAAPRSPNGQNFLIDNNGYISGSSLTKTENRSDPARWWWSYRTGIFDPPPNAGCSNSAGFGNTRNPTMGCRYEWTNYTFYPPLTLLSREFVTNNATRFQELQVASQNNKNYYVQSQRISAGRGEYKTNIVAFIPEEDLDPNRLTNNLFLAIGLVILILVSAIGLVLLILHFSIKRLQDIQMKMERMVALQGLDDEDRRLYDDEGDDDDDSEEEEQHHDEKVLTSSKKANCTDEEQENGIAVQDQVVVATEESNNNNNNDDDDVNEKSNNNLSSAEVQNSGIFDSDEVKKRRKKNKKAKKSREEKAAEREKRRQDRKNAIDKLFSSSSSEDEEDKDFEEADAILQFFRNPSKAIHDRTRFGRSGKSEKNNNKPSSRATGNNNNNNDDENNNNTNWNEKELVAKEQEARAKKQKQQQQQDEDEENEGLSIFKEVRAIELAYKATIKTLANAVRYIPKQVLGEIMTHRQLLGETPSVGAAAAGGGARGGDGSPSNSLQYVHEVTVSFVEIDGFSAIWTSFADQREGVWRMLHVYMRRVCRLVMGHSGVIDKFLADSIMSFWGAPQRTYFHALLATLCTLAIQRETTRDPLKSLWEAAVHRPLRIRAGISSGRAHVGSVGSDDRLNYTVIGSPVSVAKAMLPLNKAFRTNILVDQNCARHCFEAVAFRLVLNAKMKGIANPLLVYEPCGVDLESDVIRDRVWARIPQKKRQQQQQQQQQQQAPSPLSVSSDSQAKLLSPTDSNNNRNNKTNNSNNSHNKTPTGTTSSIIPAKPEGSSVSDVVQLQTGDSTNTTEEKVTGIVKSVSTTFELPTNPAKDHQHQDQFSPLHVPTSPLSFSENHVNSTDKINSDSQNLIKLSSKPANSNSIHTNNSGVMTQPANVNTATAGGSKNSFPQLDVALTSTTTPTSSSEATTTTNSNNNKSLKERHQQKSGAALTNSNSHQTTIPSQQQRSFTDFLFSEAAQSNRDRGAVLNSAGNYQHVGGNTAGDTNTIFSVNTGATRQQQPNNNNTSSINTQRGVVAAADRGRTATIYSNTIAFSDVLSAATLDSKKISEMLKSAKLGSPNNNLQQNQNNHNDGFGNNSQQQQQQMDLIAQQSLLDRLLRWHVSRTGATPAMIRFAERFNEASRDLIDCNFKGCVEKLEALEKDSVNFPDEALRRDSLISFLYEIANRYVGSGDSGTKVNPRNVINGFFYWKATSTAISEGI